MSDVPNEATRRAILFGWPEKLVNRLREEVRGSLWTSPAISSPCPLDDATINKDITPEQLREAAERRDERTEAFEPRSMPKEYDLFRTLTDEEYDALEPLSREQILEALRLGQEEMRKFVRACRYRRPPRC